MTDRYKVTLLDKLKMITIFEGDKAKSASTLLIEIGILFELFHDENGECYAAIDNEKQKLVYRLGSNDFDIYLTQYYFALTGKGVRDNSLQEALNTLKAKAKFHGEKKPVFRRISGNHEIIYIDLANERGEVVEITAEGWRIIHDAPIHFLRSRYAEVLPRPLAGKGVQPLWKYLNVAEENKVLIWGWLLGCFRPNAPYPLLLLYGTQGSGKSSATKILKRIIDPNEGESTCTPKDERDLIAYANGHHLLCFDNNSYIDNELSGHLCRLASGSSISFRQLYTNADEVVYKLARPMLINGISNNIHRGDLLERTMTVKLQSVSDKARRTETEIFSAFENDLPFILGGLCDSVVSALKNFDSVKTNSLPRMADFAKWVIAAEYDSTEFHPGDFIQAYQRNLQENSADNLMEDPVAFAIFQLIAQQSMRGFKKAVYTATELLNQMNRVEGITEATKRTGLWPKEVRSLGRSISRLETQFTQKGIVIHKQPRKNTERPIEISWENFSENDVTVVTHVTNSSNLLNNNDFHGDKTSDKEKIMLVTDKHSLNQGINENRDKSDKKIRKPAHQYDEESLSEPYSLEGGFKARRIKNTDMEVIAI